MKTDTRIVLAASVLLIAALATIGWWFGSLEGASRLGEAVMLLTGSICSLVFTRRMPQASPLLIVGAILGLGYPFLVESAGPVFTVVFTLSVAFVWVGIGIARLEQRARLREKQV
jgi:hypothetical protein